MDRLLVIGEVAARIGLGGGGLAQHVEGIAEALRLHAAGVRQRLRDGLAGDELLAHHPHGDVDALADQGFAAAADEAGEGAGQAGFAGGRGQLAGEHQAPGGGVDEERGALADMGVPVAMADLVADQRVAGGAVGDAQQRLGEAHQRHAFLRGQRIFVDQALDRTLLALGAQGFHEGAGALLGRFRPGFRQAGGADEHGHGLGLRHAVGRGDAGAQHALRLDGAGEGQERALLQGVAGIGCEHRRRIGGHGRHAALGALDGGDERLLDQRVRRAALALGGGLQPGAEFLVDLHADGGRGHVGCPCPAALVR